MKIGTNDFILKLGSADVSAAYIGSTMAYSGGTEPTPVDCSDAPPTEWVEINDDFDTSRAVWSVSVNFDYDFDDSGEETPMNYTGYCVLSSDGITPEYTIVATVDEENYTFTINICEYNENGEKFAGTVITSWTEEDMDRLGESTVYCCQEFGQAMYVMDFSQYYDSSTDSYACEFEAEQLVDISEEE